MVKDNPKRTPRLLLLGFDHHLQRLALVHGAVAAGNALEIDRAVEDATGLNSSFHHVREKLVHIGPHWAGPPATITF